MNSTFRTFNHGFAFKTIPISCLIDLYSNIESRFGADFGLLGKGNTKTIVILFSTRNELVIKLVSRRK